MPRSFSRLAPQFETSDELRAVVAHRQRSRQPSSCLLRSPSLEATPDLCFRTRLAAEGVRGEPRLGRGVVVGRLVADDSQGRRTTRYGSRQCCSRAEGRGSEATSARARPRGQRPRRSVVEGTDDWREVEEHRAGALVFLGRFDESLAAATASVGDPPRLESYGDLRRMATYLLLHAAIADPDLDAALEVLSSDEDGERERPRVGAPCRGHVDHADRPASRGGVPSAPPSISPRQSAPVSSKDSR